MSKFGIIFYNFFNRKWFFDKVYNEFINQYVMKMGYHISYKLIDRGVIENLGPFGISNFFYSNYMKLNFIQTGLIYHSALVILLGVISFLILIGIISFLNISINANLICIFVILSVYLVGSNYK